MRNISILNLVLLAAWAGAALTQEHPGVITGRVFDAASQKPIEYANVILFRQSDSAMVTGATSREDGRFKITALAPGNYYVNIQFIGYKTHRLGNVAITPAKAEINLGKILLEQTALNMETVEVQGEALGMTYHIDKKVINVSRQATALSGTAVDVLESVPSVTVDIEGNVSLRGSGNFTVLIDGRPSVLDPSEALQQIPAGAIENIEIVTNPSAKYDPQGASGIINVVLKKERREGRSGIANLNAGTGDKYGGDFLYDYKNHSYQATLGLDYNQRLFSGDDREQNETRREGSVSFFESAGVSRRKNIALGLRGEFKLKLSRKDFLSAGGRYGNRDSRREEDLNYAEWSGAESARQHYTSNNDRLRTRDFFALNLSYQHHFAPKGHELSAELFFSSRQGDETTTNGLLTSEAMQVSGRRSTEGGPSREVRTKLDYTLALGKKAKFEAGFHSEIERDEENTGLAEYDAVAGDYLALPQFSNRTRYDEDTHAIYAIYANELGKLGFQGGLRAEYTGRTIVFTGSTKLTGTGATGLTGTGATGFPGTSATQPFTIGRWDYFPTLHFSHQFAVGQQAMASYTRRIDRPGGGDLEPFQTWIDAYNVHIGNPDLLPEYIDSYELGYQTHLGRSLISLESYYRKTHNRIEEVRSVYADNITLHSEANIGKDHALGGELALNVDLHKKWNLNLTGNLYQYRITGALFGESFARESFNWNTRLSNAVKFSKSLQFQLDGIYNSPSVSSQGRREGYFTANAAVKLEIIDKLLSATLQVRDLFDSAKREAISQGADFYNYRYSTREAPVVMLNLKYNFNNYKAERERRQNGGDQEDDDL